MANQINDMDGLEINSLLTNFNEYDQKNNEIRLIESDKKDKLNLEPKQYRKYKDTLESLESEFNVTLKEMKWVFVSYQKNPNNMEYTRTYNIIKNKLDSILDRINMIAIDIQQNTSYLIDISKYINKDLDYYKETNKKLANKVNDVKSVDTTSKAIIDNYNDLYKRQRSYNIGMVITFIIAFFLVRKIFYSSESLPTKTTSTNTSTSTKQSTNTNKPN